MDLDEDSDQNLDIAPLDRMAWAFIGGFWALCDKCLSIIMFVGVIQESLCWLFEQSVDPLQMNIVREQVCLS